MAGSSRRFARVLSSFLASCLRRRACLGSLARPILACGASTWFGPDCRWSHNGGRVCALAFGALRISRMGDGPLRRCRSHLLAGSSSPCPPVRCSEHICNRGGRAIGDEKARGGGLGHKPAVRRDRSCCRSDSNKVNDRLIRQRRPRNKKAPAKGRGSRCHATRPKGRCCSIAKRNRYPGRSDAVRCRAGSSAVGHSIERRWKPPSPRDR
jgi:hypothetical protein